MSAIINVLSLFDGMSCGRVALERAGIPVANYFASEVDKYAIQIAKKNYPDTIHIGDVTKVFAKDLPKIDLLIGGSPCQGFSFAGKQLNFDDPRSKLFFEFVRLLKETKPKYFLLENVRMKKEFQDVISKELGVEPVEINSALVSAQNRRRLYWANFPITQPKDKGILLKDIIHETVVKYNRKDGVREELNKGLAICASDWRGINRNQNQNAVFIPLTKEEIERGAKKHKGQVWKTGNKMGNMDFPQTTNRKAKCLTAISINGDRSTNHIFESLEKYKVPLDQTFKLLDIECKKNKIGQFGKGGQGARVYHIHNKSVALSALGGGRGAKTGLYLFGVITPDRVNKRRNGQRFSEGNKFYTLTAQDRHGILTEGYIRKLTPIECERLQTLPDNYTEGVSDSQRYKMLGNGWTVDVIAHILRGLK